MYEIKLRDTDKTSEAAPSDGIGYVERQTAEAYARLRMKEDTLQKLLTAQLKKGDALEAARIAGIMASKRTWELIPFCQNNALEKTQIEFSDNGIDELYIYSKVAWSGKAKVEMEALTAASVAALTIYDMCKSIDKGLAIEEIKLIEKIGQ